MQRKSHLSKSKIGRLCQARILASYQDLRPGNLLVGRVFGHPRIKEGAFIFSSPIVAST